MRNDECIIKSLYKGKVMQSFQRDKDGWFQTSSKGTVRRCTAEQVLSHLLPPLAGVSRAIVKVGKDIVYEVELNNARSSVWGRFVCAEALSSHRLRFKL